MKTGKPGSRGRFLRLGGRQRLPRPPVRDPAQGGSARTAAATEPAGSANETTVEAPGLELVCVDASSAQPTG